MEDHHCFQKLSEWGFEFFLSVFFFVLLKTQPKTVYITRSDGTIAQGNKI